MTYTFDNKNNPNRVKNMFGASRVIDDKVTIEWASGKKQVVTITAKHFNVIHNEWVYSVAELTKNILESNIMD